MRDEGRAVRLSSCFVVMTSAGMVGTERLPPEFSRQIATARLWGWEGVGFGLPGLRVGQKRREEEHIDYGNLFNKRRDFP